MRNANGIVQIKNFTMQFNVDKMLVVEVKGKKVILHTKNDHEARTMYQSGYTDWIAAHNINKDKISDACHSQGKKWKQVQVQEAQEQSHFDKFVMR